jgi:hypothetical protein
MSNLQASTGSLEISAQCWCDKETEHIEMSVPLATAFAKRLDEKQNKLDVAMNLINSVAHIGVDFGYGKYELTDEMIAEARLSIEDKPVK